MIDIHNHLLIGVDDGPKTEKDAINLLNQAQEQGITDILITPHHYSGDWLNSQSSVIENIKVIEKIISEHQINIKVYPGHEIRVNENVINELKSGYNMTLNHSKYVLIEFPFSDYPHFAEQLLYQLQLNGYIPLIAHPERCKPLIKHPEKLFSAIEKGAIAQVTSASVTGDLGENLKETSLRMIENNLVHIIGSDAHNAENRPFLLKEAYQVVEKELGEEYVDLLKYNAEAILNNKNVKVRPAKKMDTHYTEKKKVKKKKFLGLF
ncbi:hypothetical protein ERX37_04530 [Macrococcus hajekii]|uniref:Tyrosine-protein phosphatase n=1 Tax=Macrococcus hajekii TaxID=198482 RepID=A0A4R6BNU5_9STAP|nr:CpsB/CapC family capsule biosynthesis tyrosine phosphatase [Macrococcus hajekii]TDM03357.1 hypothetical protein ERX37_04530 [Macrococcus hajekii]GGA98182.1 tyrosine protein phosphatase [Macrococcus hajekii]